MKLLLLLLLGALIFNGAHAVVVSVTNCGSVYDINEVRFSQCNGKPCQFAKGTTVTMEVDFTSKQDSTKLTSLLSAKIGTISLPAPDWNKDVCNHLTQGNCPIKSGNKYTYKYTMKIDPLYPSIKTEFKLRFQNDSNKDVLCFTLPVQLVDNK